MTLFVPRTFSSQEEWTRQSSGVINQLANRQVAVDTFTTTQTLDYNHDVALCDATGAAFTVTLPKAAMHPRRELIVKKVDVSANAVTVEGDGAETIDGAANVSLDAQWDFVSVISDGTSWSIVASTATAGGGGGTTDDPLTFNNGGAGAASGATFDGSAPVTVSYNTVGAAASGHNHDASYSAIGHDHDADYSAIGHDHDSDYLQLSGGTLTGDLSVPDEAYDATTWNGSTEVPTKNAIRDKIESIGGGWTVNASWDFAVSGAVASFESGDLTGYSEVWVIFESVTMSLSGHRIVTVSTNGGSSYDTGASSYQTIGTNGNPVGEANFFGHGTGATAARHGSVKISGINLSMSLKPAETLYRSPPGASYVGSSSPINKVKAAASVGTMNGGKAWILVR